MTATVERPAPADAPPPARGGRPRWASAPFGYTLLALLAWVPPLLTAPGKVAADTKQYLYLDPARLLGRAASMWDPNIGMGTVTHQNIGYLFPMGPFYWAFDQVGVPDWVAQRIWLGALVFFAGTGVLYLCRTLGLHGPGVVVAALAYAFSPYSLHYAARISVILLPWAGLGWMLALTVKALRDGGWRYPALFALVVQLVGGVNATALVFAGVAPVAWIAYHALATRTVPWRRAASTTLRIGVLTALTSLWWMAGLSLQGGYGLNILKYTETVRAVARTSMPNEILRGLGYWFFYGQDRIGPWIEAAENYTQRPAMILVGYGIACFALLSAALLRWRHRAFFVLLLLAGVIVAVGAHPYESPTPLGALFKAFATNSTAGLALRSTGRAIPLVVLSLALLLGAGLVAFGHLAVRHGRPRLALGASVAVGALVLANFPALYDGTYYGENLQRPEEIPQYWRDAAAYLDREPYDTRVLELPGADFAAYRWGNTVDPITPGLMDRPYVARELIPYGSPASSDLLNALDRRFQEGVFDVRGFPDLARRMAIGDVVFRNDIQYERYDLIRPRALARAFTPPPPGMRAEESFGEQAAGPPAPPHQDEETLAWPAGEAEPAPVVVYGVEGAFPIVRAASTDRPLVVAGDGEGLVDAADVGLLRGAGVVLYAASYAGDPDALRAAAGDDGVLVVTDSNRRRARRWSTVLDNTGYTEQAGEDPYVDVPGDARLDVFPDQTDDSRTVVEQRGVRSVVASEYGNPISYTPEDRAARALDRDPQTAWKTSSFDEAIGQKWRVDLREPITTDRVNLVQNLTGPRERWITRVALRFDGGDELVVDLQARSRTRTGQNVLFPERTFRTLELEVVDTNVGRRQLHRGASGVGFAEVRLRDRDARGDVRVDEVVRMPLDLLDATGAESQGHPLVLVMSRVRGMPVPPRYDEELRLARSFTLPAARSFALTGTARLTSEVDNEVLDAVLGVPDRERGGIEADSHEFLAGCIGCRAGSALDGDPSTAWTTPFTGVRDQWVEYRLPAPVTVDRLDLQVVADGRHSVPTRLLLEVGRASREIELPPVEHREEENATVTVPLRFPAMTGARVRLTVLDVAEMYTSDYFSSQPKLEPAAIAEIGIPGVVRPRGPERLPDRCRADLLTVDGEPVPVRIRGDRATAERMGPLTIEACDPRDPRARPALDLGPGVHVLRTRPGRDTAIQLDRLVLASAAGGAPLSVRDGRVTGLAAEPPPAPRVEVVEDGRTEQRVRVEGVDGPFWLVLGQSQNRGWEADVVGGESLGGSDLVDGYANGWLVDPGDRTELEIVLTWTPQRRVWASLGLSGAGLLLCGGIVVVTARRRRRGAGAAAAVTAPPPDLASPLQPFGARTPRWVLVAGPPVAVVVAGAVVAPWMGVVVGVLVALALRWPRARALLALLPPVVLGVAAIYIAYKQQRDHLPPVFEWPTFFRRARTAGWAATVVLAADAFVELLRTPRPAPDADAPAGPLPDPANEES